MSSAGDLRGQARGRGISLRCHDMTGDPKFRRRQASLGDFNKWVLLIMLEYEASRTTSETKERVDVSSIRGDTLHLRVLVSILGMDADHSMVTILLRASNAI